MLCMNGTILGLSNYIPPAKQGLCNTIHNCGYSIDVTTIVFENN